MTMAIAVFSDLDGTLLDHDSYSFAAAEGAIKALKSKNIPLILASSKTAVEIARLHAAMGLGDAPMIVENGSGIVWPGRDAGTADSAYNKLRAALARLPEDLRAAYRGFGDMSAQDVSDVTGLPLEEAELAKLRQYSEPGLWSGSDAGRAEFIAALAEQGITARDGGRFLTLSFGRTKADAMAEVAADLGADVTIALGDAPNDAEMLATADYAVIIRNDHAPDMPPLPDKPQERILRTEDPGPTGWNLSVLQLLNQLSH
jgi:mannosyl-3-phosphoglycerate phosphatase